MGGFSSRSNAVIPTRQHNTFIHSRQEFWRQRLLLENTINLVSGSHVCLCDVVMPSYADTLFWGHPGFRVYMRTRLANDCANPDHPLAPIGARTFLSDRWLWTTSGHCWPTGLCRTRVSTCLKARTTASRGMFRLRGDDAEHNNTPLSLALPAFPSFLSFCFQVVIMHYETTL